VKPLQASQIHAQPNGMVGETVGFAIALAANVSDGELQGVG
jgi:hypothetical protein